MAHHRRKKLFVDSEVQRSLIVRVVLYWLACMVTLEFLQLTWQIASGPQRPTFTAYFVDHDWRAVVGRMLIGTVLLVPVIWDVLSFSNRFAGPIFRMRRVLRQVAKDGTIEHVRLRRGDYWCGMADDLNAALARLARSTNGADPSTVEQPPPSGEKHADAADTAWLADDFSPAR